MEAQWSHPTSSAIRDKFQDESEYLLRIPTNLTTAQQAELSFDSLFDEA